MAIYYILLFCSALIFSLQFLITKQYQRRNGTGFLSSVRLSLFAYLAIALFFFVLELLIGDRKSKKHLFNR